MGDSSRVAPLTARNNSALDELVEAAVRGDVEAMARLVRQLAPSVIRTARTLLGASHSDLDDVVQQSLIALVQALPSFRNECTPQHFAIRISARIAVAARARFARRGERHDESIDVDALQAQPSHEPVDAERRRHLVRELLDTLPEEQAETLALRVAMGLSLDEVAQSTGVPVNTVRSRIRLAKLALRKRIEADPVLLESLEVES